MLTAIEQVPTRAQLRCTQLKSLKMELVPTVRASAYVAVCTWTQRLADILVHWLKLWVDHYVAKLCICGASTTTAAACQRLHRTLEKVLSRALAEAVREDLRITRILRATGVRRTTQDDVSLVGLFPALM
eukprot:COSAG02_NODE_4117_length_5753_cov_10.988893_5_plen_130_part_00